MANMPSIHPNSIYKNSIKFVNTIAMEDIEVIDNEHSLLVSDSNEVSE